MDSLLIALLDAVFHTIGKLTISLVNRVGLCEGNWSWGGYVALGFFVVLQIILSAIFLFGVIA